MSYMLEALSGSVQASALDLSQNGIATLEFQDQHRRFHHVSTLLVGRLGDLWEWIVLNHQHVIVSQSCRMLSGSVFYSATSSRPTIKVNFSLKFSGFKKMGIFMLLPIDGL